MTEYEVRPALSSDVTFLADVSIEATRAQGRLPADFDEAEWRDGFEEWTRETLDDPTTSVNVVEQHGKPVGRLRITRFPDLIELSGIQLLPRVQGQGIGTAIIQNLQAEAAARGVPLRLNVEQNNPAARRLYHRLGFTQIAQDGPEAILQWPPDSTA
ncbi:GNAT family N-acetyltransferase [Kribbella sp. NPDC026611]|uniref:GNAT family N-acetyltransferase n=1 Tax=Kribbella sp. NPDC026611 TaxID=3154911 RepID=UPI0033CE7464